MKKVLTKALIRNYPLLNGKFILDTDTDNVEVLLSQTQDLDAKLIGLFRYTGEKILSYTAELLATLSLNEQVVSIVF